jgi:hypothetical protein
MQDAFQTFMRRFIRCGFALNSIERLCRGRLTGDEGLIAHLPFSLVQSLATAIRSTSPWNLAFL